MFCVTIQEDSIEGREEMPFFYLQVEMHVTRFTFHTESW